MISHVLFIVFFVSLFFLGGQLRHHVRWQLDRERLPLLLMSAGLTAGSLTFYYLGLRAYNAFELYAAQLVGAIISPMIGLALFVLLPIAALCLGLAEETRDLLRELAQDGRQLL